MEAHRKEFRVAKMCTVLKVSKSGFYAWLKRTESKQRKRRGQLKKAIKKIHIESRETYGSPKITKKLNQQGSNVSQKTVARIRLSDSIQDKEKSESNN